MSIINFGPSNVERVLLYKTSGLPRSVSIKAVLLS